MKLLKRKPIPNLPPNFKRRRKPFNNGEAKQLVLDFGCVKIEDTAIATMVVGILDSWKLWHGYSSLIYGLKKKYDFDCSKRKLQKIMQLLKELKIVEYGPDRCSYTGQIWGSAYYLTPGYRHKLEIIKQGELK